MPASLQARGQRTTGRLSLQYDTRLVILASKPMVVQDKENRQYILNFTLSPPLKTHVRLLWGGWQFCSGNAPF